MRTKFADAAQHADAFLLSGPSLVPVVLCFCVTSVTRAGVCGHANRGRAVQKKKKDTTCVNFFNLQNFIVRPKTKLILIIGGAQVR